jgi:hypothetical protein
MKLDLEYRKVLENERNKIIKDLWYEGYTVIDLSVIFNKHVEDIKKIIQSQ